MPRKNTILQPQYPYHIYARCINREWFKVPLEEVWTILSDYLYFLHHAFEFRIHAFVLMGNHYHALISTPLSNLDKGMNYFQREVSRSLSRQSGRINQTFGGPYEWSIITTNTYFMNAYKYVYRNPVRARVVNRCEQYPYSSLHGLLGFRHMIIPIVDDPILFSPSLDERTLEWLNRANPEDENEVRNALRKSEFTYQINDRDGKKTRATDFIY